MVHSNSLPRGDRDEDKRTWRICRVCHASTLSAYHVIAYGLDHLLVMDIYLCPVCFGRAKILAGI